MGHGIWNNSGHASMMYVGKEPWHGLGTKLSKPATSAEAIKAAHLDWDVTLKPVAAVDGYGEYPIKNRFAIVPCDRWGTTDCPVFGLVGRGYTPLQNREAFAFFDPIAGKGAAIYHTAGALGRGERIWILAKLPGHICVAGDDITEKFLLLSNSHEGKQSVQIKFTPIRVVCQNTLTMALSKGPTVRVAHNRDLKHRLAAAEKTLGIVNTRYSEIEESFKVLVKVKVTQRRLDEYLQQVFRDPPGNNAADAEAHEERLERVKRDRLAVAELFENGRGNQQKHVAGTLWAVYNGVVEHLDYRKLRRTDSQRLRSVWFGNDYLLKVRAFNVAMEKSGNWQGFRFWR